MPGGLPTELVFEQLPLDWRLTRTSFNGTCSLDDLPRGLRQITVWRRAGEGINSQHGRLSVLSWLKAEVRRINGRNMRRRACVVREVIRAQDLAATRVALFAVEPWRFE